MTEHFEAKKHAYRQTQDGIVVSFVVHPNDVSTAMAVAPLGTRYMVAFAEIGDDGLTITNGATVAGLADRINGHEPDGNDNRGGNPSKVVTAGETAPKDRKPFASLPLSQQAALRCQDKSFQEFCGVPSPDQAATHVRLYCNVASRSDIRPSEASGLFWCELEGHYQSWLTDRQYAGARR